MNIKLFNTIIKTYKQFDYDSCLPTDIKKVWKVSEDKAKELAKEYCNVISFYALCLASELIDCSLLTFMTKLKEAKLLKKDGFLEDKSKVLKQFNVNFKKIYIKNKNIIKDASSISDGFYQMKLSTGILTSHFIGCYVYKGQLFISDSSNRGIAKLAKNCIIVKQFKWLLKIGD